MKNTSNQPAVIAAEVYWALDDAGVLTISGCGRMLDYACGNNSVAPWHDRKGTIERLVIEDGITEIGINAFRDCTNLRSVSLPQTVRKICAYAFRDCLSLETVKSDRSIWRYIYDKRQTPEEDTVIFGFESFMNCPWAVAKWNNFYIQENNLYACFSNCSIIEIPDGVHTLKQLSLADITVDEIVCPSTLKRMEKLVFSNAVVNKEIRLPKEMEFIDSFALADCSFGSLQIPKGYRPPGMMKKRTYVDGSEKELCLQRIPEFTGKYYLGKEKAEGNDTYRHLKIKERKPVFHKDGRITAVWDNNYFNVGLSVLHMLQRRRGLVCIKHEDEKVISVKVLAMRWTYEAYLTGEEEVMPCVYLMYPAQSGDSILPWKDSYTYFEPFEIIRAFPDYDGTALAENGRIRFLNSKAHEDWFWCIPYEDEWQVLAFEVLELWLAAHPEKGVYTEEEIKEKTAYQRFINV